MLFLPFRVLFFFFRWFWVLGNLGFLEISLGFMGTISFGSQWLYEYYTMRHL